MLHSYVKPFTPGLVPTVGGEFCKLSVAGSTPVTSSKRFIPGYYQTVDGGAHNAADAGSIPAPGTNRPIGRVVRFAEHKQTDRFSR